MNYQKKQSFFQKIILPKEIKSEIIDYYCKLNIEKATFITLEKNNINRYTVKKFIKIPEEAIEFSNIDKVKISIKYIKFLFKKSIKNNELLIIIHNHICIIDKYFSKKDYSFIKSYGEYFKSLGGQDFFGGILINNYNLHWILYIKEKFEDNIAIFIN